MPLHVEFVGELAFILLGFFLNVQFKGGDNLFSGWAVSGQGVHEPLNTRFRRGANDDVGLRGDALLSIKQRRMGSPRNLRSIWPRWRSTSCTTISRIHQIGRA